MNSNQNILVKLKQASFRINNKWLVKGVSLQIEKGRKLMEKLKNIQIKLDMFLKKFQLIGHYH